MEAMSRALIGFPIAPIPLTQGRTIYYTVNLVKKATSIADMMVSVTHEMVEALHDPFIGEYWFAHVDHPELNGEAADICKYRVLDDGSDWFLNSAGSRVGATKPPEANPMTWDPVAGTSFNVSAFWSNATHRPPKAPDGGVAATYNGCIAVTSPPVPSVSPISIVPAANKANWYNSIPITVTLKATDNSGAGIREIHYDTTLDNNQHVVAGDTATVQVVQSGTTAITYSAVDNNGNVSPETSKFFFVDLVAPTIKAIPMPAPNGDGWNNKPVTIDYSCSDPAGEVKGELFCGDTSGVDSQNVPLVVDGSLHGFPSFVTTEGKGQKRFAEADDLAGNSTKTITAINLDMTAPVIQFTGAQSSYTVDQDVNISCAASDALSSVRPGATCPTIQGPAYSFGVGTSSFNASATDYADNLSTATLTFDVRVTFDSLAKLVNKFVANAGVANSLDAKLRAAASAAASGKTKTKDNILKAFRNELAAQTGQSITAANAAILQNLGGYL